MKMATGLAAILVVLAASWQLAWAEEGAVVGAAVGVHKAATSQPILDKFDKDGDGKLDDDEQAAMHKAVAERRRQEMLKKYDKDGDGKLSKEERAAMPKPQPRQPSQEMLKKFDKDGDGKLNDEERAAAKAAREAERAQLVKEFDKDGDGKLGKEERAAMGEATGGLRHSGPHAAAEAETKPAAK